MNLKTLFDQMFGKEINQQCDLEDILKTWNAKTETEGEQERKDNFYLFEKSFDFTERIDSCEFITQVIQIHKNNIFLETEANDLGHIVIKVFAAMKDIDNAVRAIQEIESLFSEQQ